MNSEIFTHIFQLALTCVIGVVSFFLRRTVSELDECKKEIAHTKNNYAPKSMIDECRRDIAKIKEDYITKEDFFREQSENRRKLDRIMDILLEMKGESKQ